MLVVAAAANRWGPRWLARLFYFLKKALPRAIWALSTRAPRGCDVALGKELFAGQNLPRALFRGLPLGKGFAKGKRPFAMSTWLTAKARNPVVLPPAMGHWTQPPVLHFILTATLPVQFARGWRSPSVELPPPQAESLASSALKLAATTVMLFLLLRRRKFLSDGHGLLHLHMHAVLYGAYIWCAMELAFACAGAPALWRSARDEGEAAVRPAIPRDIAARPLEPAVEPPGVRRAPSSGERPRPGTSREGGQRPGHLPRVRPHARGTCQLVYYFTQWRPTEEMAAYFLLHGACRVAEERQWRLVARLPRPLATMLVRVFVVGTSSWLVLVMICQEGRGR